VYFVVRKFIRLLGALCLMNNLPSVRHIGVIMDGNRRWASLQGESKFFGYKKGFMKFIELIGWCLSSNIKFLTVFAFSTENFKRNNEDFKFIYSLIDNFFEESVDYCSENRIIFEFVGRKDLIGDGLKSKVNKINLFSPRPNLSVQIAFGYGGRDEIVRAIRLIADDVALGKVQSSDIDEKFVGGFLDTSGIPDIDMIIRTGNAKRLSNFLLWQSHYSEIYFVEEMWPAFTKEEFDFLVNESLVSKKVDYGL
jgi:undecaprenyl diphosphate synthase